MRLKDNVNYFSKSKEKLLPVYFEKEKNNNLLESLTWHKLNINTKLF